MPYFLVGFLLLSTKKHPFGGFGRDFLGGGVFVCVCV